MADIIEAVSANDIKNGTIVVSVQKTATFIDKINTYAKNTPVIGDIEDKYIDRFDDPTYYTA
jgi:hypothetical protein